MAAGVDGNAASCILRGSAGNRNPTEVRAGCEVTAARECKMIKQITVTVSGRSPAACLHDKLGHCAVVMAGLRPRIPYAHEYSTRVYSAFIIVHLRDVGLD